MNRAGELLPSLSRLGLPVSVDEVRHLDGTKDGVNVAQIAMLITTWCCLLVDSPLEHSRHQEKPDRVILKFKHWLISGPILECVKSLSSLADEILESSVRTSEDTVTGVFVEAMKDTPIFREYLHWYRTRDPLTLWYVLTFLRWGKKTDYEDPEMDAVAFRNWLAVEKKLSDHVFHEDTLEDLRQILHGLIGDYNTDYRLLPKFGPGAVCEPGVRGDIRKSNSLRFDAKIDRLFFRSPQLVTRGSEEDGFTVSWAHPDPEQWTRRDQPSADYSKLLFVPKDVTKSRSICMEPNTYQWAQQAVLDNILRYFRTGPMRNISRLEDQSRNRALAEFGSLTGEIDTIDLSSASDSVSLELVKRTFPRRLLYALLATRSSKVELPSGEKISVKKFAPMGSAVCFPTQCLIFAAVSVLAAMQEAEGMPVETTSRVSGDWWHNFGDSLRRLFAGEPGYHYPSGKFQPLAVYGDDIAIDTRLTTRVVHLLTSLGFSVNTDKSFEGGQCFRESCGGYYYEGEDVTPIRYSIKRNGKGSFAGHVASVVSLANRLGDRGLLITRSYLIQYTLSIAKHVRFTSERESGLGIYTTNPRNDHLLKAYDVDCQREEIYCSTLSYEGTRKPRAHEVDAYERYRYLRWWASRAGNVVTSEFSFGVPAHERYGTKLRRRWTPV
jgi:hypothetical protein